MLEGPANGFEAQSLLSSSLHHSFDELDFDEAGSPVAAMKSNTMGALRAYWRGTVVCMAGFLFGYDSGIIGMLSVRRPT